MDFFYQHNGNDVRLYKNNFGFDAHLHSNIEVLYVLSGTSDAYIDDKTYSIKKNDLIIVFPNQIHQFHNCINDLAIISVFPYTILSSFEEILSKMIPVNPIISNPPKQAIDILEMLYNSYDKYDFEIKQGLLTAFFGIILNNLELKNVSNKKPSLTQNILEYCSSHYMQNITIEQLSKDLHISQSYISHIFNEKLNISFREYINSMRVSVAKNLLSSNAYSIEEVSKKVGFDSTRTFNRAFLKTTGSSPTEYKKSIYSRKKLQK